MNVNEAVDYLLKANITKDDAGKKIVVDDDFYYMVQCYNTKEEANCKLESHRKYVDIQYMVEGKEAFNIIDISRVKQTCEYNQEKDIVFYELPKEMAKFTLSSGNYITLYPNDAHRPGMKIGESKEVLKVVGKVKIKD